MLGMLGGKGRASGDDSGNEAAVGEGARRPPDVTSVLLSRWARCRVARPPGAPDPPGIAPQQEKGVKASSKQERYGMEGLAEGG